MSTHHTNANRGFSLVEMLVYIGIFTFVSVGSVQLIFSFNDMIAKYRAEQLVYRSAASVLERILYDVRDADTIDSYSYSPPAGSLTLSGGTATMAFSTTSDAVRVSVDGSDLGPLTENGVVVTDLRFYGYSDVTEFVRVKLTLSAMVGKSTVTKTFYAGGVLRGSYGN